MEHSDSIVNIIPALIAAQQKYETVKKTKYNKYHESYYADLSDYIEATLPALNGNGLTIIQGVDFTENQTVVNSALVHTSGEFFSQTIHIPGKQEKAQDVVSASTYARRVQWTSLAGVAAEDDDGNSASGNSENKKQPNPPDRPKVNQKPSTATQSPRPEEKKPSQPENVQNIPVVRKMDKPKEQVVTGATIISGGETTVHTQSTADTPYTKEEYLAVVAPKVKSFYDKADRADILTFIKENSGGKKTEELSRAEWTAIFSKMDEKFGGKQ